MAKKVCVITSVHLPADSRIYEKEIKSLRTAGYEVTFVNPYREGEDDFGVKYVKAEVPTGRIKRIISAPKIICKKAMEIDADVYHFHDPELLKIGSKLAKKGKVIFDSHEDTVLQIYTKPWLPKLLRSPIAKIYAAFEKKRVRKIDAVVVATENIRETFEKYGCKNITVVKNYPILKEFDLPDVEKQHQVCYVGGITEIRGIFEIVRGVENTDYRLALAGTFESAELEQKVKEEKGYEQVDFYGQVGRKEVADILARSEAGLVILHPAPNYINSLPIKMFEYMAAGIPVIYSNFEFWKSLAARDEDSICGIAVDPKNLEEIRNALDFIKNNPHTAKEWGENGIRLTREVYNWAVEEKKLLELYSKF